LQGAKTDRDQVTGEPRLREVEVERDVIQRGGEHREVVRLEEEGDRDEAEEPQETRLQVGDGTERRRDPPGTRRARHARTSRTSGAPVKRGARAVLAGEGTRGICAGAS